MPDSTATPPNRIDALRDVARQAAATAQTPAFLRRAGAGLPSLEDRAVAAVLQLTRLGAIQEVRAEGRKSRDDGLARFDDFHRVHTGFPVRLTAGRFAFHYDAIATDLLNNPADTPMYSAWVDARPRYASDRRLGVVFPWPRIKTGVRGCGSLCVLHNHDSGRPPTAGAFRISFTPAAGLLLHLEPLPAFIASLGA